MSEYQYYEFLAVDRPLTPKQIEQVRAFSSRADITSTSFVNEYNWGDFKGDPAKFLERWFDLMLYYANWGTHTLMMGLPADALPEGIVKAYCVGEAAWFKIHGEKMLLGFDSQDDSGDYDESYDWSMASLAPIREELLRGDLRPLYLGWLLCAHNGELAEGDAEPPVPPGMGKLSAAQTELVDFLRIDEDLLELAAGASAPREERTQDVGRIVAMLSPADREELLTQFLAGDDPRLAMKVLRRHGAGVLPGKTTGRTVGELLAEADRRRAEREEAERHRRAAARARRDAETARQRTAELDALLSQGERPWQEVETLVGTKTPGNYERAVSLLIDLRDAAARTAALDAFTRRVEEIRARHAKKSTFIDRLKKKKLV
ncbi:MAG TPA: hypothetical protein VH475_18065 [Tepidisphaeraceae bacterium]|jgi:hypothetical protein